MRYRVNPLFSAVAPPPIAEVWKWVAGRDFPEDKPLPQDMQDFMHD